MTWLSASRSPSLARSRNSVMRGDASDIAPPPPIIYLFTYYLSAGCPQRGCMLVDGLEDLLRDAVLRQVGQRRVQQQSRFRIHLSRAMASSRVRLARVTPDVPQREIPRCNLAHHGGIAGGRIARAVQIRGGLRHQIPAPRRHAGLDPNRLGERRQVILNDLPQVGQLRMLQVRRKQEGLASQLPKFRDLVSQPRLIVRGLLDAALGGVHLLDADSFDVVRADLFGDAPTEKTGHDEHSRDPGPVPLDELRRPVAYFFVAQRNGPAGQVAVDI